MHRGTVLIAVAALLCACVTDSMKSYVGPHESPHLV